MRHEVHTSEGVTLEVELAGAGTRFLAVVVDLAILAGGFLGVLFVLNTVQGGGAFEFAGMFLAYGALLLHVAYHAFVPLAMDGRTPGKRMLGVRILSLDGGAASAAQLGLRALLTPVDHFLPVPIPLGLLVIATGPRRQRLGDLAAGTLVVREAKRGRTAAEPWAKETWSGGQTGVTPARRLALSPRDARLFDREDLLFLRAVVTRRGVDVVRRRHLFREVAKHYLERLGQTSQEDPRVVLKEVYLFLREFLAGQPAKSGS